MMEDWTDIIGEELESIEETLPADDWSVLQQKYSAAQKRKRIAVFAWAGGITSIAAAIALVLLLVRPDDIVIENDLVAEMIPSTEGVLPVDSSAVVSPVDSVQHVAPSVQKKVTMPVDLVRKPVGNVLVAETHTEDISSEKAEEIFDVIRDTTSLKDKLLADASTQPTGTFSFDDFPEDEPRSMRSPMSIGISGSTSDSPIIGLLDKMPNTPPQGDSALPDASAPDDPVEPDAPNEGGNPLDSLGTVPSEPSMAMMKSRNSSYIDSYDHEIPVSVGVSARFQLTDRLSINTGLNYTKYTSTRKRLLYATSQRQNDRQTVHYLGIPVRLDFMAVNRKRFNLYLGAGMQVDKCVYAKVGDERLHEKKFLFGVNGTMGIQVNIVPRVGLYFEPEVSYALNEGTIETFRSEEPFVVTVRGGLRFNF